MNSRETVMKYLREGGPFNLISHIQPDGDSIGSLLALGEALTRLGKEVRLFTPAAVPGKYVFLQGSENISSHRDSWDREAAAVVLDCSDLERTGYFKDEIQRAALVINIDHHITNRSFGAVNLVDPHAAATGEIIFHLLQAMGLDITRSIAESLYVAISTDTGSFKYDNTTAETHRTAAALLESHRLNTGELSQRIFDEHPLSYYLVLKKVLSTLEMYGGKKIAVITASREMLEQCGSSVDELDGMINYARNIAGVEMGIMFFIDRNSEVKAGFRAKNVDVSALAGKLGGGGHPRAAGCRLKGDYGEVKNRVIHEALAAMGRPVQAEPADGREKQN